MNENMELGFEFEYMDKVCEVSVSINYPEDGSGYYVSIYPAQWVSTFFPEYKDEEENEEINLLKRKVVREKTKEIDDLMNKLEAATLEQIEENYPEIYNDFDLDTIAWGSILFEDEVFGLDIMSKKELTTEGE